MRVDVFKRTSDDWYPSYELAQWNKGIEHQKLVEVSFLQTGPKPKPLIGGEWRVCIWGGDDCGMERDFADEKVAWCCFLEVIGLNDVTMAALKERGFVGA